MADLMNLNAESGRNIIGDDATPTLTLENTSTGNALFLKKNADASPTIAVFGISTSVASGVAFAFSGQCVQSTASGTASLIAGIRVQFTDPAGTIRQGWIPVAVNIA